VGAAPSAEGATGAVVQVAAHADLAATAIAAAGFNFPF
jgi:hypothetical protein